MSDATPISPNLISPQQATQATKASEKKTESTQSKASAKNTPASSSDPLFPQAKGLTAVLMLLGIFLVATGVLFRMYPELISPPATNLLPFLANQPEKIETPPIPPTSQPSLPQEITEPLPLPPQFSYSHTDGTSEYVLSYTTSETNLSIIRDGKTVFPSFSSSTPLQKLLPRFISQSTIDFWLHEPTMTFFTLQTIGQADALGSGVVVLKTTLSEPETALLPGWEGDISEIKSLYAHVPNWYMQDKILTYLSDSSQLILNSRGGDGCGGQGVVWKVNTNTGARTDLLEYAFGCAEAQKARYGGIVENKLVVAETSGESRSDDEVFVEGKPFVFVTGLYLLDPITLTKTSLAIDLTLLESLSLSSTEDWKYMVTFPEPTNPAARNRVYVHLTLDPQELIFSGKHPDFPESTANDFFAYNYATQAWRQLTTTKE